MPRLTPDDLASYRTKQYAGDQLDAGAARRLVEEVESAWADLARQRVEIAKKAASALEQRLAAVATYNQGGCPKCRDAEARAGEAQADREREETRTPATSLARASRRPGEGYCG